jgi:peptide-methionine (S)-S-oxide reductase
MAMQTERAVLAGGCFWGMQDLIRKMPGVIKTRVAYAGGDVPNATYHNHGTHAEAIEITFDANITSYHQDYLERFPDGYTCHFVRPHWKLPRRAEAKAS